MNWKQLKEWWKEYCMVNVIKLSDAVTAEQIYDFIEFCKKKHDEIVKSIYL